ncbi:MAG: hypothetical protein QNK28_10755 [Desulfobacterales bacterium]|nr:hypothetical protein [Desulfobacterales bacterium]
MNKKIILLIGVLITFSFTTSAAIDKSCLDSIKVSRDINALENDIKRIRDDKILLNSSKLKVIKITGLKKLKASKSLSLKTRENIINQVNKNNKNSVRVSGLYRSINKNTFNLKKDLQKIARTIENYTGKLKKENRLKEKKRCLITLFAQLKKIKKELIRLQFNSFPHTSLNTLDLNRLFNKGGTKNAKSGSTGTSEERWENTESIADSEIDEAKKDAEEANELMKQAIRIIQEVEERQSQNVQVITGI